MPRKKTSTTKPAETARAPKRLRKPSAPKVGATPDRTLSLSKPPAHAVAIERDIKFADLLGTVEGDVELHSLTIDPVALTVRFVVSSPDETFSVNGVAFPGEKAFDKELGAPIKIGE